MNSITLQHSILESIPGIELVKTETFSFGKEEMIDEITLTFVGSVKIRISAQLDIDTPFLLVESPT